MNGNISRRRGPCDGLTNREGEVTIRLARGFTQPEIARQLSIKLETAKTHAARVRSKLEAHTGRQAGRKYRSEITPKG